ncbi:MAG: site-2 protease family protein, partial [Candidatus Paceibacteria bacterium]
FNLVPIPPLDGSRILAAVLGESVSSFMRFFEIYGLFLVVLFIFFLFPVLIPVIGAVFNFLTGLPARPF